MPAASVVSALICLTYGSSASRAGLRYIYMGKSSSYFLSRQRWFQLQLSSLWFICTKSNTMLMLNKTVCQRSSTIIFCFFRSFGVFLNLNFTILRGEFLLEYIVNLIHCQWQKSFNCKKWALARSVHTVLLSACISWFLSIVCFSVTLQLLTVIFLYYLHYLISSFCLKRDFKNYFVLLIWVLLACCSHSI